MIISLLEALIVIGPLLGSIAYVTIAERKIMGSMQRRIGPNRVGQLNIVRYYHHSSINHNSNNNNNNKLPTAIKSYDVGTDRSKILSENKDKTGIYMWVHKESGKFYIGSAFDLSKRFNSYYTRAYLSNVKGNSYIYNAILKHDYFAFHLRILEYLDVSDLSVKEARKLILEREQHFIDLFSPTYNINPIAGSRLGAKHTAETISKMSGENNHFYGKTHTIETKASISRSLSGKTHSEETKTKMSLMRKGKPVSPNTLEKTRKKVFVYSKNDLTTVLMEFNSYTEAGKYFNCNGTTISRNINTNKVFRDKWVLSSTLLPC